MKICIINGPNINFLGVRQPDIYGSETYSDLCVSLREYASTKGVELDIYQSNHEGALIDYIQSQYKKADGFIINPGAYTHTSVAIPDAVTSVFIPAVEVHISDINNRENFRKINYISDVCINTVIGLGTEGYFRAFDLIIEYINEH